MEVLGGLGEEGMLVSATIAFARMGMWILGFEAGGDVGRLMGGDCGGIRFRLSVCFFFLWCAVFHLLSTLGFMVVCGVIMEICV